MNEHKSVPNIRFKGFEDKWKKEKLGNIATVEMNKRIYKDQTSEDGEIPFYKIGTFGKKADSFISKKLFDEYKKRYSYPKVGDILISASGTIGNTIIYKGEDAYFQDSNIVWLNVNHKIILNSFLYNFYKIVHWKGLEGSTIKRLYNSNILSTSINYPSITEQQKIGDFFAELDKLLDLQQQKINKFDLLKKSLLQKLFPKHDAKIPELRFKGYEENWRDKKTLELVSERDSKIIPNDDYPLKAFVAKKGISEKGEKYNRSFLVKSRQKKYKKTEYGDLIYSSNNLEVGSIGINRYGNACISPVYSIFKVNNSLIYDFLGYLIQRKEFIFNMIKYRQGVTYGQWKIHESDFLNIQVLVPETLDEKQKIGNLLSKVDQLIELENKKLHKLQQVKKCLLQNMFVE